MSGYEFLKTLNDEREVHLVNTSNEIEHWFVVKELIKIMAMLQVDIEVDQVEIYKYEIDILFHQEHKPNPGIY